MEEVKFNFENLIALNISEGIGSLDTQFNRYLFPELSKMLTSLQKHFKKPSY